MSEQSGRDDDCRCLCGSLVARRTAAGIELKCRRCKRTLLVSVPPHSVAGPLEVVPVRKTA